MYYVVVCILCGGLVHIDLSVYAAEYIQGVRFMWLLFTEQQPHELHIILSTKTQIGM
jgi:hypothetical protein